MHIELTESRDKLPAIPIEDISLYINKLGRVCVRCVHWQDKHPEIYIGHGYDPSKGPGLQDVSISFHRFTGDLAGPTTASSTLIIKNLDKKYPFDTHFQMNLKYETVIMFLGWEDFDDIREEDSRNFSKESDLLREDTSVRASE
jgi:hypothetical protein